jgi:myo-inositol-1-phosphate synthase
MFVARRLRVMAWEGYNMLGNRDGLVLEDPASLGAKVKDKDGALRRILRDPETHTRVRIDYVPSLDDWKTAFDFIHFRGFLGARMALSFTWQGCDSALAAPLVLDLARLAAHALRRGEKGTLPYLAPFFKSPLDVEEQDFGRQQEGLLRYVRGASS